MGYAHLFDKCDLALLHDWLEESGELYMDLDRPHSGGTNNSRHFITNLPDLRAIVARETHREVAIYIFRERQFRIRGIVNERLLISALAQIPDRQDFQILCLGSDPLAPCEVVGFGDCHDEMREEFTRLSGRNVRVGQDPFDQQINYSERLDEVFAVSYYRNAPGPRIEKNRTSYPPFDADPDRYAPYIDFW